MESSDAAAGLLCTNCGTSHSLSATATRCPSCDGALIVSYNYDDINVEEITNFSPATMWGFDQLLPATAGAAVSMSEGNTPMIECPDAATELGVEELYIKDEAQLPTGTFQDRGFAVTVSALASTDITDVALPSTGAAGQSAAAYAARADLDAHVFQPSRADFISQAMTNVHDADLNVVKGRYQDAVKTYSDTATTAGWHPLAPFATPYRIAGVKTIIFEILDDLDWSAPDVVVLPEGSGLLTYAIYRGIVDMQQLGLIDEPPALLLAQPTDCAPLAEAIQSDEPVTQWTHPDTICGELEVSDPDEGEIVTDAVHATNGIGATAGDKPSLGTACWLAANDGVELRLGGAVGLQSLFNASSNAQINDAEQVVVLNTGSAIRDADLIRSHLMSTEWDRMPTPVSES